MRASAKEHKSSPFGDSSTLKWTFLLSQCRYCSRSGGFVSTYIYPLYPVQIFHLKFLPFTPQWCQQRIHFFSCLPMPPSITVGRFILKASFFERNFWNVFVGFSEHFLSLYSDINISTVSFDHSVIKSERQWVPPLWSSGQSSWLHIQRSRVRFPTLQDFLRSSGSGTGSTQPCEYNLRSYLEEIVAAPV
jgi:hypothetical protein